MEELGYKHGMSAHIDGAPSDHLSLLALPLDVTVTWLDCVKSDIELVHLFVTSAYKLETRLRFYRQRITLLE